VSARPDTAEHIVVEFDQPQAISRLVYEVEETRRERTQEVRVEASDDGGPHLKSVAGIRVADLSGISTRLNLGLVRSCLDAEGNWIRTSGPSLHGWRWCWPNDRDL
jgi:hypothetical protein